MHNKTMTNYEPPQLMEAHQTMDQQQQNHRLRKDSSLSSQGS